ncbi:MAG: hypothetical protein QXD23_00475 [Candidatus Micrarchaeaceae archaeon]
MLRKKFLLIFFFSMLFLSLSGASQTYCSDLFNNVHGIVSNTIYNLSTFNELISFTGLIIIAVLLVMSLIYGLGVALGLDSFKQFAKTEYIESFVNLLILVFVVGLIFSANGATSFFSNLTNSAVPYSTSSGTQLSTTSGGIKDLYLLTCNNILNVQVLTGITILIGTYIELIYYQLLSGLTVSFSFSGTHSFSLGNLIPNFSIAPFAGLGITQAFIYNEFSALSGFIGVSIGTIILLFVIYFLFPILFFVGVLFRSFPWTRAAGGSLIALFISFFIIFPSILSVFTFSTASNIISNISSLCSLQSVSPNNACFSSNGFDIVSFAQKYGLGSLSGGSSSLFIAQFLLNNGLFFNSNISLYSEEVGFYVIMLIGLFISFLISYDILGILTSILGSPSFSAKKLFGKIV